MTGSETLPEAKPNSSESVSASGSGHTQKNSPLSKEQIHQRRLQALKKLKVKPEQLETAPPISVMLKKYRGGLRGLITAMRFATNDLEINSFLKVYDSIPLNDRPYVPWEAIMIAAQVNVGYFLNAVHVAAAQYFGNISKILMISNHPQITKSRIEYGLMPAGDKDRNAIDIMVGAMPSAKGPTFIGKAVFGSSSSSNESDDDDEDDTEPVKIFGVDSDTNEIFPPAHLMQDKLQPIRQKQLDAPK